MIAKAEWFVPRKFGWGLGVRSWQGIAYILAVIAIFAILGALPMSGEMRMAAMAIVAVIFTIDVLMLMPTVYSKLDEREQKHQLMAERNSSFVAVIFLAAYLIYASTSLTASHAGQAEVMAQVGPILVLVMLMAGVKGGTLLWLERSS